MTQSVQAPTSRREPVVWEEFRSLALPLLGEHFPPELIEDNGDSLTFVDRRERLRFFLTESAQGITIGDYEERNTVGTFFTSPSIELATIALTLLVREGLGELVDMDYPPDELLGPVPGTDYSITEDRSSGFHLTHKTDSTLRAYCDYFTYARAIAVAASARGA